MDQIELVAKPRSVTGKRVKRLRAEGVIPLVVYGPKTEPINIQTAEFDAHRIIAQASGQLITLRIEGEDDPRMVLARGVQRDSISGLLLHADLYEVEMTERIQVEVSLTLIGESALVNTGQALLMQVLNSVEISCLPADIMQSIEVDISGLVGLEDAIHVRDLALPRSVEVLTPGDEMIVRLQPLFEEEEEEEEELAEGLTVSEVEVIQRGRVEEEG